MRRVTRTVTNEHAVKVVSDLVDGVVPREAGDAGAAGDERAEDILFDAAVNYGDMAVTITGGDVERSLGGYFLNQVDLLGVYKGFVLVRIVLLSDGDAGEGRALLAEVCDDGTSVDAGDGRNTLTRTPGAERFDGSPVGVTLSSISYDDTDGLQMGRFKVFEEAI